MLKGLHFILPLYSDCLAIYYHKLIVPFLLVWYRANMYLTCILPPINPVVPKLKTTHTYQHCLNKAIVHEETGVKL